MPCSFLLSYRANFVLIEVIVEIVVEYFQYNWSAGWPHIVPYGGLPPPSKILIGHIHVYGSLCMTSNRKMNWLRPRAIKKTCVQDFIPGCQASLPLESLQDEVGAIFKSIRDLSGQVLLTYHGVG